MFSHLYHPTKGTIVMPDTMIVLYKRPFRKEKEVTTFLIKALKWNWAINLQLLSQMRRLNV